MSANPNAEIEIQALLSELWQRHLPSMRERLQLLETTAERVKAEHLTEPERLEALSIAHKMAGNLGMFGYKHAGEISSAIEQALKEATPEELRTVPQLTLSLRHELDPHLT